MTDDLVKWLRIQSDGCHLERCGEAADLIEKLEAALRRIRLYSRETWACKIAKEALDAK